MERKKVERRIEVPHMAASKRFGRYKGEKAKDTRKAEVTRDVKDALRGAFLEFEAAVDEDMDADAASELAWEITPGFRCTVEEVLAFSRTLGELQDLENFGYALGFFLTSIYTGGEGLVISTWNLHEKIHNLGRDSSGDLFISGDCGDWTGAMMGNGMILVYGNAGDGLGHYMEWGRIIVEGNAGDDVGNFMKSGEITIGGTAGKYLGNTMMGGKIHVEKNVGNFAGRGMTGGHIIIDGNVCWERLGWEMKGGKIEVRGFAGHNVGSEMEGGEIHLLGEVGSVSENISGGRIYHKGKLIVDK
jgi:hypothetical protein